MATTGPGFCAEILFEVSKQGSRQVTGKIGLAPGIVICQGCPAVENPVVGSIRSQFFHLDQRENFVHVSLQRASR